MPTKVAIAAALSSLLAVSISARQEPDRTPPLSRIINSDVRIRKPIRPCTVPSTVAWIAEMVGLPSGLEYPVRPCDHRAPPDENPSDDIELFGVSVGTALKRLARLDPKYRVVESGGVLIARPLEAWTDRKNVLNQTLRPLEFADQDLNGAMNAFMRLLGAGAPFESPAMTSDMAHRFSLSVGTTSIFDMLNAFVVAHGALSWEVEYCTPSFPQIYAQLLVSTRDGSGLGTSLEPLDSRLRVQRVCSSE